MNSTEPKTSYEPIAPFPSLEGLVDKMELKSGDPCPQCGVGILDYDGMLNLACPQCGYALGGCFT